MKKIYLMVALLLLQQINVATAQCLFSAAFQKPDTACAGVSVNFVNTSQVLGASSYSWDFCAGDLEYTPLGQVPTQFVNGGNRLGVEQVFDSSNYYAFIVEGAGNLICVSYGNAITNTPTHTNLGNVGGLLGGAFDIKMIKVDTSWYAFICTASTLVRIDFGSNLSNPTPSANLIATNGTLSSPVYMDFVQDNGTYYALCVNVGASVTMVDLGNNILNTTPATTIYPVAGSAVSVSAVKSCDQWYAFVAHIGSGTITRMDFGNSLSNAPQLTTTLAPAGLPNARKLQVVHDNAKWYGFELDAGGTVFSRIDFGADITNTMPVVVTFNNLNGFFVGSDWSFTLRKFNSQWCGIVTNWATADIKQFYFPDACSGNPSSVSTDSTPVVSYVSGGWQHAELTVMYNGGVSLVADSFYISPQPSIAFETTPACENRTVQFNNQSTITEGSITSYNWNFNNTSTDTATHPIQFYATPGYYDVTLTAVSGAGCTDSLKVSLKVNTNPIAQFASTGNLCSGYNIPFNDATFDTAGTIINWLWDFDDLITDTIQTPLHTYNNSGSYNVSLIVISSTGCADTVANTITVLAAPQTAFTVFNTCIGETALFNNQTTIIDTSTLYYQWNFGDNDTSSVLNPLHSYSTAVANYNVTLLAQSTNGCVDSITQVVHIGNKPQAWFGFSTDTACAGNAITFSDSSIIATGDSITNWYWDFGDNTRDSVNQNPSHVYQTNGTYTITFTAHSPASCDSTITRTIFVIASPQADFTTSNVCFGNAVSFNDASQSPSGSFITDWQWSFGDTLVDTLNQNTTHNYSQYGTYNATLQVTSDRGCIDTIAKQVIVYELPDVDFSFTAGCTGNAVYFTDLSVYDIDSINAWQWNFGDNTGTSAVQNPSHTYYVVGNYTVQLIATNTQGCKDSISKSNLFIRQSPDFTIGYASTCFGNQTQFNYVPITSHIGISTSWDFGDSTLAAQVNPIHTYSNVDTFLVSLTVTELTYHCVTTHATPVIIHPLPQADFATVNQCTNTITQLNDNSTIPSGAIVNWNWLVNNSLVATHADTSLQFSTTGNYTITLQVSSDAGCIDSSSQTLTIHAPPVSQFSATPPYGSIGSQTSFLNLTNGVTNLSWNFGDNSPIGTDTLEIHSYQDTGFYAVTLIATNAFGCIDTVTKTYRVLIPLLDIAVVNVTTKQNGNLISVTATLMNTGNIDINTTELKATLEGLPVIHEFPLVEIQAGALKPYTLASSIEMVNNEMPAYVCVEALNPNNQTELNLSNNIFCKDLLTEFSLVSITPNPASATAQINLGIPAKGVVSVTVSEGLGKIVYSSTDVAVQKGYNSIKLDVAAWSKGLYEVRVKYLDTYQALKLIRN